MRLVFAVLSACVLVCFGVLASPAKAGDYYDDGSYSGYLHRNYDDDYSRRSSYNDDGYYRSRRSSYYNGNGNGYSSSSCCYRRVARYERTYDSYSDRPYRSSYYDRPSYRSSYYGRSRYDDGYVSSRYVDDYSASSRYSGYSNCYARRVPVADGRGGWVWGARSSCY